MTGKFAQILADTVGPKGLVTGPDLAERSATGWGKPRPLRARHLVRPKTTAEVAKVLMACQREQQTVVTHGGLTGLVHGADSGEADVVLSLERMTGIEEIDPVGRTMTVLAGTPLQRVQEAAEEAGLFFPLDLGARGSATIGGNAATNAGGNRVIRYGMTRDLILGMEAVLADGTVVSSMNRMIKNNAGYDLKHLFIGSEGTLGVITRLVLRLFQKPASQNTGLVACGSFEQVTGLLRHLDGALGGALSAYEVMWGDYYNLVTTHERGLRAPLEAGQRFYVLAEFMGGNADSDAAVFSSALEAALERELIEDAVVAKSDQEREEIWALRDGVGEILSFKPVFVFDVSLPIKDMEDYVESCREAVTGRWPDAQYYAFGHLGDGNLHFCISAGDAAGSARGDVERIMYEPLEALGGSVSAEHGIGLEKKAYLHLSRSPEEIATMRALKKSLDPAGLLNPGKIFD